VGLIRLSSGYGGHIGDRSFVDGMTDQPSRM
jgi:hypothetical protein